MQIQFKKRNVEKKNKKTIHSSEFQVLEIICFISGFKSFYVLKIDSLNWYSIMLAIWQHYRFSSSRLRSIHIRIEV